MTAPSSSAVTPALTAQHQFTAPQAGTYAAKRFQATLIDNLCTALASHPRPPCLLRSPTGSGKTYMLTQVLQRITAQERVLWLWFVPYVNLVAQTTDALASHASDNALAARPLAQALNEEPQSGLVLVSTVQAVASAKARKSGYTSAEDDARRSIATYMERARAQGLQLGLVVDEAHIALDSATEFGQFVKWLEADYLLMASATPRDQRLTEFVAHAGYSDFATFSVSRADVVAARLNKKWIEAVVYDLRESMQSITDLKLTVLRRAWRRNQVIAKTLQARGLATVPLLLVQVGNGDEAIDEAHQFLLRELQVPAHAIGIHSAAEPDPVMMAAIANDTTRQVLIFKQSAGTGFDAPRAFVLASTKPVNDPDFAMQFIGRVMRVSRELQQAFPDAASVPPELDTAYIFLGNATAQAGFAEAARATQGVQSQLEGQLEHLHIQRTAHGGVGITNKPTAQAPLRYDMGQLLVQGEDGKTRLAEPPVDAPANARTPTSTPTSTATDSIAASVATAMPIDLFSGLDAAGDAWDTDELDSLFPPEAASTPKKPSPKLRPPTTQTELLQALEDAGVRAYPRLANIAALAVPERFTTEVKPIFDLLAMDVQAAAQQLPLSDAARANAVRAALNLMTEREIRTELYSGAVTEEDVQVVTDKLALMARTCGALEGLGLEEQDCHDVIQALSLRVMDEVERALAYRDEMSRPTPAEQRSYARDAACWVIHKQWTELQEALQAQWASRAKEEVAALLPDALLVHTSVQLVPSRKNTYGVLFPASHAIATSTDALSLAEQRWLKTDNYVFADSLYSVARMDATYEFNTQELAFAKALDRTDFVAWWHRNPQGKPYSIALMRSDSQHMFYPDFVICLTHFPGDAPLVRLVETKHDTKDAKRKAGHHSRHYGKVLFMTKDASRFKVVNDDGSLAEVVDFDDLAQLREWMRQTLGTRRDNNSALTRQPVQGAL